MHIIGGIVLGVALLYFWLLGHWFARTLVFLGLLAIGVLAAIIFSNVAILLAAAAAWPVAGIPTYYWRWRLQRLEDASYDGAPTLRLLRRP